MSIHKPRRLPRKTSLPAPRSLPRREFLGKAAGSVAVGAAGVSAAWLPQPLRGAAAGQEAAAAGAGPGKQGGKRFALNYLLSSAMYGYAKLEEILPEVAKTGAAAIDIWPKVHGNQREQIAEMGIPAAKQLLAAHSVRLGGIACYRLGPFGLRPEMTAARQLGGEGVVLVCGAKGPRGLAGQELKAAVRKFAEQLKPHVAAAENTGCVIAVENHGNSLIESPDSIRWFGDLCASDHVGIALAPHHLPQDAALIAGIARDLGKAVKFFYAQQHGKGSSKKLPKSDELLQMPGRGPLDFAPILAALKEIDYRGYTEIFMHPVPRGVPILSTTGEITAEINRSRTYLENCLAKLPGGVAAD